MQVEFTLDRDVAALLDRHILETDATIEDALNSLLRRVLDPAFRWAGASGLPGAEAGSINELLAELDG